MQGVIFIVVQFVILFLCLCRMNGNIILFPKQLYIYKIMSAFVNGVAIVFEFVFLGNKQILIITFVSSFIICGATLIIFELFCSKKYFKILKSRIVEIINENHNVPTPQEIRNTLVEKYDYMYSISDIKKILKKI